MCSEYELSDEEVLNLVSEIASMKAFNVCLSGGEPLLRKDLLFNCIEVLSLNNIRTVMLSNGTLLDEKIIKNLMKIGLQEIEISLDGSTAEINDRLRGKGSFEKIIKTLTTLGNARFPRYETSMVFTSFNWREVVPTIKLLKNLGTPVLILRPMLICGRAPKYKENLQPTPLQYRKIWYEINELKRKEKQIEIIYADPLSHLYSFSAGVPFFGMEIKANGDLISSPYIQLPLGNIRRHSIKEYWNKGWPLVYRLPIIKDLMAKIKGTAFEDVDSTIGKIGRIDLIDDA